MKRRAGPLPFCLLVIAIATVRPAFATDLKSEVAARSSQVDQLADESREAVAAWQSSIDCKEASGAKARFLSQEASCLADADSRKKQPDTLLTAEMNNLTLAQNAIKNIIEISPEAQKLAALEKKAATIQSNFTDSRNQLGDLGKIVLRSLDRDASIDKLESTQLMLKTRVGTLSAMVAAQQDPGIRSYNQGILSQASALLSGLDAQIAELKLAAKSDQSQAAALSGETDLNSARTVAADLVLDWNRASNKLRDVANTDAQVVDACNVPAGLPKSVEDAIASAYSGSPSDVSDRVRKGFEAVTTRDWKLAKAWFEDALNHDPTNAGLKSFVELAEYTDERGQQGNVGTAPASPSSHTPLQIPQDSDIQLLFPGLPESEAKEMNDYIFAEALKTAENDPVLLKLSNRPDPNQPRNPHNPYEIQ